MGVSPIRLDLIFRTDLKTKTKKTPLCQRQGLRPSAPTMADSPASNLGADTKENLENRLARCLLREVRCPQRTHSIEVSFGTADIFRGIMVSLYVKGKENGHVQAYAPTGAMVLK